MKIVGSEQKEEIERQLSAIDDVFPSQDPNRNMHLMYSNGIDNKDGAPKNKKKKKNNKKIETETQFDDDFSQLEDSQIDFLCEVGGTKL